MNEYDDYIDNCKECGADINQGDELCRSCKEQEDIDETNIPDWRPE